MDELVAKVAQKTGIEPSVARKAVIIMLKFLLNAGPRDKVEALVDDLPGAREAIGVDGAGQSGPKDVMEVFNELTAAGLGMGGIQGAARAFGAAARERAGNQAIDEIVRAIPGLSQFL
jgi:hypothetical protein